MNDAHNHLHDARFNGFREDVIASMRSAGISRCVVNGTRPEDWPMVADLADKHPDLIIPSFGLHPWYAAQAPEDWLDQLQHWLTTYPHVGIGECGLDRWINGHDIDLQSKIFISQLELATRLNRPLSIHCVRAWGHLVDILESHPLPRRGFLLHSYGGSTELIPRLAKLGAYFSFSGSILQPKNAKKRQIFQQIPVDRLLVETDAPEMLPPDNLVTHPLPGNTNHPANLPSIISAISDDLDTSLIENNFKKLFT